MTIKMATKQSMLLVAGALLASQACLASGLIATMTVNPTAALSSDRIQLVVSGTYTCGPLPQPQTNVGSTFAFGNLTVFQANGRNVAQAQGGFSAVCDGNPQTFQAPVIAQTMPWHGGKARVVGNLHVQLCDDPYGNECETANSDVNTQIGIR